MSSRVELFGWIGRQQFEETWMALLSVLNSTPSENTPPEELPFINLVKLPLDVSKLMLLVVVPVDDWLVLLDDLFWFIFTVFCDFGHSYTLLEVKICNSFIYSVSGKYLECRITILYRNECGVQVKVFYRSSLDLSIYIDR